MKVISEIQDLREFGINYLTGEACALSMRGLYDLDDQGIEIVCEALSISREGLAGGWNSGGASIMLSADMVPTLGVFALRRHCHTVFSARKQGHYGTHTVIYGLEGPDEELIRAQFKLNEETNEVELVSPHMFRYRIDSDPHPWMDEYRGEIQRIFTCGANPHVGTRNVHAATGRVA